jgi:hypothetical protein
VEGLIQDDIYVELLELLEVSHMRAQRSAAVAEVLFVLLHVVCYRAFLREEIGATSPRKANRADGAITIILTSELH